MKTLLRNVRSVFIVFALVLTVCYSQSRHVYAAMSPLDTSGQWVSNEDEGFINNAENEPNSEYAQANLLAINTEYTGALGHNDDADWFCFNIPANGQYTFKITSYGILNYHIYNENLTDYISSSWVYGSIQKPGTETNDLKMSKCIYYLEIPNNQTGGGKYVFSLKEKGYQSSPQESSQPATTATPVQSVPNNNNAMSRAKNFKVNKRQYWTVGGNNPADWFKIVVPYKGRIQVDFHSANDGLTKLILCKSNGKAINYAASKNVVILSAGTYFVGVTRTGTKVNYNFKLFYTPVMSGPRITRTSSSRKSVTVKFANVKGVTGYQISIATNKKFKKAWHIMATATTRKITGLKRNRKYFVKVRAYKKYQNRYYYGDFSKVRTVYTTR